MRTLILLQALLLSACSQQPDIYSDYISRLENVLDTHANKQPLSIPRFPNARDLEDDVTGETISIREFLSLRECKLHTVLAHRNSQIGKLAKPSQRLFNDLDILASGPACVAKIKDRTLAKKLESYLADKQQNIGKVLWNAILSENENRSFWSLDDTNKRYPYELKQETIPSIKALNVFVKSVLNKQYVYHENDYRQIEKHLGILRFGDGGTLLSRYAKLSVSLQQGNALIEQRLERPLCRQSQPTTSARYFQNVVNKFFVEKLQKNTVLLNQREAQLMPSYRQLESQLLKHSPSRYQQWASDRNKIIANGRTATKRHAQVIHRMYVQCGLTVGH